MTTKDTADRTRNHRLHHDVRDPRCLPARPGPHPGGRGRRDGSRPRVRAGWNFKAQLLLHHSVEDTHLWPRVRSATAGLAAPAAGLTSALKWHLKHEEDAALPLIQSVCTPADWRAFADAMRRRPGVKGAAIYVPWILDGIAPGRQRRFLAAPPVPVRVISRLLWEPRYRQRDLWGPDRALPPLAAIPKIADSEARTGTAMFRKPHWC